MSLLRGPITAPMAAVCFELHLQQEGLRFSKVNNNDAIQFTIPFSGGFEYIITFRESRGVLATMNATFSNKIGRAQRTDASIFFAMVNFSLAMGCFQLDLRDGEVLYWAGVPLGGMDAIDCTEVLTSWFHLFRATFDGHRNKINVLMHGGTVEEAFGA